MVDHASAQPAVARWRFLVCFLLAAFFIAFRNPDWWSHPQFLAEDGAIFFNQQLVNGTGSILTPYNGYIHLLPRLFAWTASLAPVIWHPLLYELFGVTIASACAAFFTLPEWRSIIASDAMRVAISLLAIANCSGEEIFANINSCQVFLVPVGLLLLVSGRSSVPRAALAALILLTAPALILFLPFAIWRWFRGRDAISATFVICAILQVAIILTHPASTTGRPFPLWLPFLAAAVSWIYRAVLTPCIGLDFTLFAGVHGGAVLGIALLAIITVLAIFVWRRLPGNSNNRRTFAICLSLGLLLILEVFAGRHELLAEFVHLERFNMGGGARYFAVPSWLFLIAIALCIELFAKRFRQEFRAAILLILFLPGTYENYRIHRYEDFHWPEAAARIEQWKRGQTGPVQIPINPSRPNQWWIVLP